MTLKEFTEQVKYVWVTRQPVPHTKKWEDHYDEDMDTITNKYSFEFGKYTWNESINKEVETLWLRKNTKLGKALK